MQPSVADEWFGVSVAVDGDTLAVAAAASDTVAGVDAGAVYVFVFSAGSWSLQATIEPSGAGAGHRFGADVELQGDTLIASSCDAPSGVSGLRVGLRVRAQRLDVDRDRALVSKRR
ncbi:MAG: FG-GAP repeat protein [Sandaracinaceae bacterium]|nr:FG-GAP repeat protein [Sandaracinaceae bacterium]